MSAVRSKVSEIGVRRIVQFVFVVAFFGLFVGTGGWRILLAAVAGWFEGGLGLHDEFKPAHRIHAMTFSVIIWTAVIGLLAQFRSPRKHVAGQLMALVPWIGLILAFAVTDHWGPFMMIAIMGALTLLATIAHPVGRDLVSGFSVSEVNRVLLVLVLVAAVPLLAYSATQVGLQTGTVEPAGHDHDEEGAHEIHQEHIDAGHFTLMAAFGFIVIGVGLLASVQLVGWWLPAWLTGGLVAFFGLASTVFPETASSAGLTWGIAAILWGVTFVVAAELTHDGEAPSPYGARKATSTAEQ